MKQEFDFLGKKISSPQRKLDTFEKPGNTNYVRFETEELTGFCPVTRQPDFYTAILEFEPDKLCIESKSLKLYYWSYREEPLFAESLADKIVNDVDKAIKPKWVKLTLHQKVRGGLQLTTSAERRNL